MTIPVHIVALLWKKAHARLSPEETRVLEEALQRHPEWMERWEEVRQTDRILHTLLSHPSVQLADIENQIVQRLEQEEREAGPSPRGERSGTSMAQAFREWLGGVFSPPLVWATVAATVILAGFIGIRSAPVVGWESPQIEVSIARGEEGVPSAVRPHDPQFIAGQLSALERSLKKECRRAGIRRAAWFKPAWVFKASVRELPTGWLAVVLSAYHAPTGLQKEWERFFKDEGELAGAIDGWAVQMAGELAREKPPQR